MVDMRIFRKNPLLKTLERIAELELLFALLDKPKNIGEVSDSTANRRGRKKVSDLLSQLSQRGFVVKMDTSTRPKWDLAHDGIKLLEKHLGPRILTLSPAADADFAREMNLCLMNIYVINNLTRINILRRLEVSPIALTCPDLFSMLENAPTLRDLQSDLEALFAYRMVEASKRRIPKSPSLPAYTITPTARHCLGFLNQQFALIEQAVIR